MKVYGIKRWDDCNFESLHLYKITRKSHHSHIICDSNLSGQLHIILVISANLIINSYINI